MLTLRRLFATGSRRNLLILVTAVASLVPTYAVSASAAMASGTPHRTQAVDFRGYRLQVPGGWRLVDLTRHPHACVRFDRPAVYLGAPGDQQSCPAQLLGGAPALQLEPLTARATQGVTWSTVRATTSGEDPARRMPQAGPLSVAVPAAGVLVTAQYGAPDRAVVRHILTSANVTSSATPSPLPRAKKQAPARPSAVAPGSFLGRGFDTCAAPSPATMSAWRASSPLRAVGVYIGGVNRGCAQPNLTAAWVSQQVSAGWHLIPTYVGLQAPCSGFYNRVSYDEATARRQGRSEGRDAVAKAQALGISAGSTLYADMEGYDNTNASCVQGVLGYLSGWVTSLHANGYTAGVYSSASSGMSDLSAHYNSTSYLRPDHIWLAWWNGVRNVDGGSYVRDTQWNNHQRIHQYAGNVWATYGGYRMNIDRDYLDVGAGAAVGKSCPTQVDFAAYPLLEAGDTGPAVAAAQCLLLKRGFDPGAATGTYNSTTAAAVHDFKVSRNLNADSTLGWRGWTALLSAGRTPYLHQGSSGPAVRKLQRSLTAALQRTVAINGSFDAGTRRAVRHYQATRGLAVTGAVGTATWRSLQAGK